jgi:hypothetical protein
MMAIPLLMPNIVFASTNNPQQDFTEEERESGFYNAEGYVLNDKDRPPINPDFAPDEDCNIAYELKCIPGSQQSCFDLDGFHNGEDNVCSPVECQEGYASADDEETGLCITYEKCESDRYVDNGYILLKDESRCAYWFRVCDEAEHRGEDYCIENCKENPDRFVCRPDAS